MCFLCFDIIFNYGLFGELIMDNNTRKFCDKLTESIDRLTTDLTVAIIVGSIIIGGCILLGIM